MKYEGKAKKLDGVGFIYYSIYINTDHTFLEMYDNDCSGTHTKKAILLDGLVDIVNSKEEFESKDFQPLLDANNNNKGFFVAILIELDILEKKAFGQYVRTKNYQNILAKLFNKQGD